MELNTLIDSLIYKYFSGNLVPILGCELFNVETRNRKTINIHEYLIEETFKPNGEWIDPPKLLSELPLAVPDFDRSTLLGCYKLLREKNKKVDQLSLIAALKHFKVFIVATVFKEFEKEFRKVNGEEEVEVFKNYYKSPHGLPEMDFNNDKRKIVYLFDNIDSPECAINDEELLESIYSLSKTPNNGSKKNLLSYLEGKSLLFIGCDFPDWFMRYCIRVLYNKPFEQRPTYIINDHPPKLKYQEFFFRKYHIQLVQSSPVGEFINSFCKQASLKDEFNNRFVDSIVFISYSIKFNKQSGTELNDYLYSNGVETYFDDYDKEIGSHENKIKECIMSQKTKILVSIISRQLIESMEHDTRSYIRDVEWYAAFSRIEFYEMGNKNDKFCIVPYFADDEREYFTKLPQRIKSQFRFGVNHGGFEELFKKIKSFLS